MKRPSNFEKCSFEGRFYVEKCSFCLLFCVEKCIFAILIDDFSSLSIKPIEVKSGRDYTIHSALSRIVSNDDYHVESGVVLSNEREIRRGNKITYMPIYSVMFMGDSMEKEEDHFF